MSKNNQLSYPFLTFLHLRH